MVKSDRISNFQISSESSSSFGMSVEEQTRTLAAELREWRSGGAASAAPVPAAAAAAADQAELRVASAARAPRNQEATERDAASRAASFPSRTPSIDADQQRSLPAHVAWGAANGWAACVSCERHREEARALREELGRALEEADAAGGERDGLRGRLVEYQEWEKEQDAWVEEEVFAEGLLDHSRLTAV